MCTEQSPRFDVTPKNLHKNKQFQVEKSITLKKLFINESAQDQQITVKKFKNPCMRCKNQQSQITCISCASSQFCNKCDKDMHGIGKFINHLRNYRTLHNVQQTKILADNTQMDQKNGQNQATQNKKTNLATIFLTQVYDSIIFQIDQKFKAIIDVFNCKRQQIISKILMKRDQQLIKVFNWHKNKQALQKSKAKDQLQQKSIICSNKLKNQKQLNQLSSRFQYKTSMTLLDQLSFLISKIELKNLVIKKDQPLFQSSKKIMKSSMIVGMHGSPCISPNSKASGYLKSQMSRSTLQIDKQEPSIGSKNAKIIGLSEKILKQKKQTRMLAKTKSQKILFKSPDNTVKYYKKSIKIQDNFRRGQ